MEFEHNYDFYLLLDAVLNEPHKVKDIVVKNRAILDAENLSGENVLCWLALENLIEGVSLLRSLGSKIPQFTLCEAIEMGNTEMVILLLELGADIEAEISFCRSAIDNEIYNLSSKKKRLIRSYFEQYGHEI
ncbi:hypothetical protein [Pseudomonas sp. 8BK]|uniref:hypothetical protein n=1 Tax=Pseudomonas sp. 8BK TaxID=2653164 RepID=UPI00135BFCE5|nr:hypothetical protein [Pseudomonas sp. 8BK]